MGSDRLGPKLAFGEAEARVEDLTDEAANRQARYLLVARQGAWLAGSRAVAWSRSSRHVPIVGHSRHSPARTGDCQPRRSTGRDRGLRRSRVQV